MSERHKFKSSKQQILFFTAALAYSERELLCGGGGDVMALALAP